MAERFSIMVIHRKSQTVILVGLISCLSLDVAAADSMRRGKGSNQSNQVDLRPRFKRWRLEPKSQGQRNTCSVCVTTLALEYALARQENDGKALSVEYLNWACNQVIGNTTKDRGQFFDKLLLGFGRHGICLESQMPYAPMFTNPQPSPKARETALEIAGREFQVHWIKRWTKESGLSEEHLQQIKDVLDDGWPVCYGSNHSLLIAGYLSDPSAPGGGWFLVADSGKGAFGQRTFQFIKDNGKDAFWVSCE